MTSLAVVSALGARLKRRRHALRCLLAPLLLWAFMPAVQAREPLEVTVNDTYINVYTGPGRGYPIFHVVERGENLILLKQRTDWIKIETRRGQTGWIRRDDMRHTLGPDGEVPDFASPSQSDYLTRRFELGVSVGDFAGADSINGSLGYRFTENLTAELRVGQNTGQFSDSQMATLGLIHQPFPEWRVSPFFGLAAGRIKILPSATLVEAEDREDNLLQASLGSYIYLSRRFFLRVEYTNHQILTSRDTNEEVNEWKIGFNVFF